MATPEASPSVSLPTLGSRTFELPFPHEMKFTIEPGCSVERASEGVVMLLDICESLAEEATHSSDPAGNLGHAMQMLLGLSKAIATSINHACGGVA